MADYNSFDEWLTAGGVGEPPAVPGYGGWGDYNLWKSSGGAQLPTYFSGATDEQKAAISALEGKSYQGADPDYLAELKTGWGSGKYSYENVTDAYGRLTTQAGALIPEAAPAGGGSEGQSGYVDGFYNPLQSDIYGLAKEQIAYASRRLGEIEQARKLADMTGTLTSDEKKMFDEMESSAVANLKSQVNEQSSEVWDAAIADLVNRGVLQGTVGEKILSTIGSDTLRMIGEGVNTIRGQKNAQMLQMIEGNKNRALTWQQMLTNEAMGLLGIGQGYAGQVSTENMATETRALQKALAELGANVQLAGFASNEAIAAATREIQLKQLGMTKYGLDLDAATRLQVAGMQSNASSTANKYGLAGNLALGGAGLLMKYGPSWYDAIFGEERGDQL